MKEGEARKEGKAGKERNDGRTGKEDAMVARASATRVLAAPEGSGSRKPHGHGIKAGTGNFGSIFAQWHVDVHTSLRPSVALE